MTKKQNPLISASGNSKVEFRGPFKTIFKMPAGRTLIETDATSTYNIENMEVIEGCADRSKAEKPGKTGWRKKLED